MVLATRSIYESQYRMERPSQGNGDLVFRRKDEVNRFRVVTLDSRETCAPVPFCRRRHVVTYLICSWLRQEQILVRRASDLSPSVLP
jgi:hypothetical protein